MDEGKAEYVSCSANRRSTLPTPTIFTKDSCRRPSTKKTPGHIPRAPNPFILFRCDFVKQNLPIVAERDHRNNISRAAGRIWKGMTEEEKEPWVRIAEQERAKFFEARRSKTIHRQAAGEKHFKRTRIVGASSSALASSPSESEISDTNAYLTNSSHSVDRDIGPGKLKSEQTDNKRLGIPRIISHCCSGSIDAFPGEDTTGMPSLDSLFAVETEMDLFPELSSRLGIDGSPTGHSDVDQEALFLGYSPMPAGLFPEDMIKKELYDDGKISFGEPHMVEDLPLQSLVEVAEARALLDKYLCTVGKQCDP